MLDSLDYNRRTLLDAYKKVGHHDIRWDEAALKLLDMESRYFLTGDTNAIVEVANLPTTAELEAAAYAALAAGCDDPTVLDAVSVAKKDSGKTAEARTIGVPHDQRHLRLHRRPRRRRQCR